MLSIRIDVVFYDSDNPDHNEATSFVINNGLYVSASTICREVEKRSSEFEDYTITRVSVFSDD